MNNKHEKEEHLERLWYMKEDAKDSIEDFKRVLNGGFNKALIDELSSEGLVRLTAGDTRIALTEKGEERTRKLIRAHRLAERLLHDVLGGDFESGACEFEHTVTPELVDGICTLLGHPRECPHGSPIPEGECCKRAVTTATSSIVPLTELTVGQSARIAYVNCRSDQRLHKMDGLHIRPGVCVKLHQIFPSYVIECEGAHIAIDKAIAANICVWREPYCQANLGAVVNLQKDDPVQKGRGFFFSRGRRCRRGHRGGENS